MTAPTFWSATRRGASHEKSGTPNQDSCLGIHFTWGDFLALSDGVGSNSESHVGSRMACRAAADAANTCLRHSGADFELILPLLHDLWRVYLGAAPPESAHATCRFAFTWRENLHIASLGDGMTAVCGKSPEDTLIFEEDKQDSFVNVTDSLGPVSDISLWRTATLPLKDWHGVLLCSDGLSEDYRPETRPRLAWSIFKNFASMAPPRRRRELKKILSRGAPGHHDDKTIIALCWRPYDGN